MSSVSSSPAQVDRRTGYFYVVTAMTTSPATNNAVVVDTTLPMNAIMTSTQLTDATAPAGVAAGVILRDMGKQVTIVDATTGIHTQVWRRVQVIDDDGNGSEGVQNAAYQDLYVLTWAAAGTGVSVVRTG
jgi:hypothetical protein